jgi:hypothetical protein
MSTTFGIPLYPLADNILVDEDGCLQPYISENFFNDVFFRGSKSGWLNNWAENLDENTRVYPLDNTPQGIYTIKDCKELLKNKI